ncbi:MULTISPECIES: hypothetical protein [Sinorhizobium]|uniref:hypothetical protein n=1 Tax=Sinorhizobium TaxID=28105 RepID=UPI000BE8BD6C|nr:MULTISPECIES: hypothetical protein [Sinorhizobium]PDT55464.1 hypothetical protein CO664_08195 [Sinorhizobium sp. NG07B]POH32511.1 hypothetical protein ATY30_11825 [Sinorhizobium americanum]
MKKLAIALVGAVIAASSAYGQATITRARSAGLIDAYRAYISRDDLFSSSGARLTRPWQVIRQDRANFHTYGIRDRGDQSDTFFGDAVNRQALEVMLSNGSMTSDAADMIIRGDVWVEVEIYGRGDVGRWVDVTVSY